ncbi:AmmeMemoRadiSam system protein B [Bacteroidota bacterium]
MKTSVDRLFFATCLVLIVCSCSGQTKKQEIRKIDRKPAVAGSFYPDNKSELQNMIAGYFNASEKVLAQQPLAVIVPHAGYVFSGGVAAAAYKQIDRQKQFEHVFIIGSSHTMHFEGASVYTKGDFATPAGTVPIDPLAASLAEKYDFITTDSRPHQNEHSLETQLPFLQYWLKKPFTIIPIIIGSGTRKISRQLAQALKPYFNENNLFIISTDFSHYPTYSEATVSDQSMADAILSNSSRKFLDTKEQVENKGVPNLLTAACGWTSILTLLDITEKIPGISYKKILYRNSGDSQHGERNRVVGYHAICAIDDTKSRSDSEFKLSRSSKIHLLQIARNTIEGQLANNSIPAIDETTVADDLRVQAGAFVTLKMEGKLRGCIGRLKPQKLLYQTVQTMAISAAVQDHRFAPVKSDEIPDLEIEISVLTPLKKIKSIDEIEMGKHGIYIVKGNRKGTYLPQVATETKWSKEEFLGHCANEKAQIGWEGWKEADIYVYEAIIFSENDFEEIIQ